MRMRALITWAGVWDQRVRDGNLYSVVEPSRRGPAAEFGVAFHGLRAGKVPLEQRRVAQSQDATVKGRTEVEQLRAGRALVEKVEEIVFGFGEAPLTLVVLHDLGSEVARNLGTGQGREQTVDRGGVAGGIVEEGHIRRGEQQSQGLQMTVDGEVMPAFPAGQFGGFPEQGRKKKGAGLQFLGGARSQKTGEHLGGGKSEDRLPVRSQQAFELLFERVTGLGWPVFVKPANMGSSVGVSKAKTVEEIDRALDLAFTYDEWAVVEEAVVGREIEVAVLGNLAPRASVPGEIVPGAEFYDYADKYLDDGSQTLVPAPLTPSESEQVRALAIRAFTALRCEGLARVDFFYEEGGRGFLLNELNTMPGFTPISMYPKLWIASGLSYRDLIDELVRLAIERHSRRRRNTGC